MFRAGHAALTDRHAPGRAGPGAILCPAGPAGRGRLGARRRPAEGEVSRGSVV